MSTLYIRHPSKASIDSAQVALACPFALVSDSGAIERQGTLELANMAKLIEQAKQIILLLAGSDVSLLRIKVPPLSANRLKAALPNMVEDQLVADPEQCVVVAQNGPDGSDGMRMVAVADKPWLEKLVKTLQGFGASKIRAVPAQLCLPLETGSVSAAISEATDAPESAIDLTLRMNQEQGIGLPVLPDYGHVNTHIVDTLRALVPEGNIHLSVPPDQVSQFEELADSGISVQADHWSRWIAGSRNPMPDLTQGLVAGGAADFDWSRWRWALILTSLVALIHIIGLNIEWLRARQEANSLRQSMVQGFQAAFPKDPLSTDLPAQVKQKIELGKIASGQAAPSDFTALAAAFGEAWTTISQSRKVSSLAGFEYKEKTLTVRLKNDGESPLADMQQALAARNLSLKQVANDAWEVRQNDNAAKGNKP